ncbi:MAG: DinB family protein [Chloroflexi bacterium]|nr:DinB family protein [Chloroflexota bacterium]
MSAITDHARSMLAYNHWANGKILDAASGLSSQAFAEVRETLAHAVGTEMYWHGNWTGREFAEPNVETLEDLRRLYEQADADLAEYGARLTDEEWARSEAWWKRWGFDGQLPVGPTLFQVIFHGIHHRAEVAVALTQHGRSPGDLDYLVYLREQAAGLP